MTNRSDLPLTAMHWGTYRADTDGQTLRALYPFEEDVDPSEIAQGYFGVMDGPSRITSPMVRKGWLDDPIGRNRDKRGSDDFVAVSWEKVETLIADELKRVRRDFSNEAIFAGSYGWGSAGRFHHAQGHLRRFLNLNGGHVSSRNTYSLAAGEVICKHAIGGFWVAAAGTTDWRSIVENSELVVAFGGLPVKNGQIAQGGVGRHRQREAMLQAKSNGVEFVNISPLRSDTMDELAADWIALRPSTDTALMIGLCHVLLDEDLLDRPFLNTYTTGFAEFEDYLLGATDGIQKSAAWAADICGLETEQIIELARNMASKRTMVSASWSLTRQDHGEQPFWAAITLAAMLGQIGLAGGGVGLGYSAVNSMGLENESIAYQAFPQGPNPIATFIPVARISDMLENPGGTVHYDGQLLTYPDIKLVWWAAGNPFHHHQDLNRMRRAWTKPDTVIVNDWTWSPIAQYADIVLPSTNPLERQDLCMGGRDPYVVSMEKVSEPPTNVRDDFEIFKGLARAMSTEDAFTEGRSADEWQRWMYDKSRFTAAENGVDLPDYDTLRAQRWHKVDDPQKAQILFEDFRANPTQHPLPTPSGQIEIWSQTIADYGYSDCPPHPTWMEPYEWLGKPRDIGDLHLISNQPKTKLHSQLDNGPVSQTDKVNGHEKLYIHPTDAKSRGIVEGDLVELFNPRGRCLCVAVYYDGLRRGVVQMSTGAWYAPDPDHPELCRNGNPNVLTRDKGTSSLAQGPTAHTCLVGARKYSP